MAEGVCMEHSGTCAKVEQLEKNDEDIFKRLREVEFAVVKTSVITGAISAVGSAGLVVILEKVWK